MTHSTWSRKIRIRDSRGGRGRCVICGGHFPIWRLQAHHIRPKALYPELATSMANGVSLCAGCHMGPVHSQNAVMDIKNSDVEAGWRMFVPMFDRWVGLAVNRE